MSFEIKIPNVGESISEVTIGRWIVPDGSQVEMDDPICELESDKATFELNAEVAGVLKTTVKEGDTVMIGDIVGTIDESAKATSKPTKDTKEKDEPQTSSKSEKKEGKTGEVLEMVVPAVGESINEVTLGAWSKSDGDFVEMDEVIAEIESDKATFELTAEAQGYLKIVAKEGETLEIGALICKIEVAEGEAKEAAKGTEKASAAESKATGAYAEGHPSPAASKILAEKGIAPEQVKGSGVSGRITKEDAENAQKPEVKAASKPEKQIEENPAVRTGGRNQRHEKMSTLRKTISRRLVSVKNETAMLTTFNEVNMKPIMDMRSKYKEKFKEKYDIGLGFMSFFTKACCTALQEWPSVNAQIHEDEIIYSDFCDISIAVSAPKGLVVPVVRNAESMSFDQIEKEILRLAVKAREGKLSIDEMQGGTFTITNGGVFGSMMSTPIINAPQSAILGMHNIVQRPIAENGEVVVRPMMYVALSYDHRIIDGRESVSFLVRVKELLEDPARLLLGI
jgi:2-oxoglutarate dehydrogenase E2 component (dihydrolipoamide succinyltransferase)